MQFQESRYKMAIDIILICYCNLPEEAMPCILHYRVVNTYISHTKKKKMQLHSVVKPQIGITHVLL